jgi:hypothetical protein
LAAFGQLAFLGKLPCLDAEAAALVNKAKSITSLIFFNKEVIIEPFILKINSL